MAELTIKKTILLEMTENEAQVLYEELSELAVPPMQTGGKRAMHIVIRDMISIALDT
jgi:hypothetical protein